MFFTTGIFIQMTKRAISAASLEMAHAEKSILIDYNFYLNLKIIIT